MQEDRSNRDHSVIAADIKKEFTQFLQLFSSSEQPGRSPKYLAKTEQMLSSEKRLLVIQTQDLITYNADLANLVFDEYFKYEPMINEAFTQLARECERNMGNNNNRREDQRQTKYEVTFDSSYNSTDLSSVRDLRCDKLGQLFSFRGTVTRTTEVRPELIGGIFRCKTCNTYSKPVIQQFKYTQPKKCFSPNCDTKQWQLDIGKSEFADFQKIRVQQDPSKIPPGAMPRSIDVIVRNQNTEKGQPGDICRFIGYLCVLPEIVSMLKPGERTTLTTRTPEARGQMMEMDGVRGLKGIRELNYRLAFISTNVIVENNQFREEAEVEDFEEVDNNEGKDDGEQYSEQQIFAKILSKLTEQEIQIIRQFKENPNLYEDLANSLFPSIYGQSQIKKALLLQLFGGIHKKTKNKISIRGDINILIVGDPSTAKSQFLKAVNKFVPRSVYTNGKTTSAAGLTATVTKDESGSVGIEAGALMLADNGICCIDEFDKMNYADQTAIHEAMEQQTISIAKAGVYATLNARTSILAAANPVFGRYDKSKSLKNNLNISAPIMSRFDLFFVVCDETNDNADANLSEFIINMHRNKQRAVVTKYDSKSIKLYISTSKKLKPMLTSEAAQKLRKYYSDMRNKDKAMQNTSYRVTVRQLESMIRISEGLAKLYLDTHVKGDYVDEAYRLISTSIMKLEKSPITLNDDQLFDGQRNRYLQIHPANIALEKQLEQKRQDKKSKQVAISHQLYQEIQKNVVDLFKKRQEMQRGSNDEIQISQDALVTYLLSLNFDSGMVNSEEESIQMKKIINAVVKKLIREERVLMIFEDNEDPAQRVLKIHPNFSY